MSGLDQTLPNDQSRHFIFFPINHYKLLLFKIHKHSSDLYLDLLTVITTVTTTGIVATAVADTVIAIYCYYCYYYLSIDYHCFIVAVYFYLFIY